MFSVFTHLMRDSAARVNCMTKHYQTALLMPDDVPNFTVEIVLLQYFFKYLV